MKISPLSRFLLVALICGACLATYAEVARAADAKPRPREVVFFSTGGSVTLSVEGEQKLLFTWDDGKEKRGVDVGAENLPDDATIVAVRPTVFMRRGLAAGVAVKRGEKYTYHFLIVWPRGGALLSKPIFESNDLYRVTDAENPEGNTIIIAFRREDEKKPWHREEKPSQLHERIYVNRSPVSDDPKTGSLYEVEGLRWLPPDGVKKEPSADAP